MKLGVLGSLVWDVIHGRDPAAGPVEEWGGVAYALGGMDASLPEGWEIVPLIKVGRDLRDEAASLLSSLRHLTPGGRCVEVPVANNRVTLRYQSAERRCERMSGGVPGWTWSELGPMVRDLDALYINFISGFELKLGTARALRQGFHGPIYADLHSLFLAMPPDGLRQLRQLPAAHEWFACFDAIQLNEEEMHQLGEEPMAVAAAALGAGVVLLAVTLGPRGSVYFARPDFTGWGPLSAAAGVAGGPIRTALVPAPVVDVVDPTGCGDVFGATLCASLLAGLPPDPAVGAANRMAARNATLKGAGSLASLLGGHLARAGSRG